MNVVTGQQGWTCPKCTRVWAPHIAACGPCNQVVTHPYPAIGTGAPANPLQWTTICGQRVPTANVNWNFSGDDLSYQHQDGDPA